MLSPERSEFISSPNSRVSATGMARRATNSPVTIREASSVFIDTSLKDCYQLMWLRAYLFGRDLQRSAVCGQSMLPHLATLYHPGVFSVYWV